MKKQYENNDTLWNELDDMPLPTALSTMSSATMNARYHQTKRMMCF